MFVKRKQNWMEKLKILRLRYESSNIVFECIKNLEGFEVGKTYKPFAYSVGAYDYSDFAIFDKHGKVLYMTNKLVKRNYFRIVHFGNLYTNEFVKEEDEAIKLIEYENKFWKVEIN